MFSLLSRPRRAGGEAPRRALTRAGTALAVLAGTALTSVSVAVVAAPTASAAAPFDCVGAVYLTDNQGDGAEDRVLRVGLDGATSTTSLYDPTPKGNLAANSPNQLGISANGARAINIDRHQVTQGTPEPEIVNYVAGTNTTTRLALTATAAGASITGAINPLNGQYYYGGYTGSNLVLYVYNPQTNTTSGPVATIGTNTTPPSGTANGDIAFDSAGRLYYVYSTTSAMVLYKLENAALPTTGAPNQSFTATELTRNTNLTGGAVNGIAFASDGYLYLGQAARMIRTNPINGEFANRVGQTTPYINFPTGVSSTDLATCATPSQLTVEVTLPDGRLTTGDQFTSGFSGSDYDGTPAGPSSTTTGTGSTTTGGSAGGLVLPGDTYTGTVTGSGGTQLPTYATYYTCTNDVTGETVQSGRGSTFSYTPATGGTGALVTCRVTAEEPEPAISLTKSVSPQSFTTAGQVLTYTFNVRNTGNTVLDNVSVTDTMTGLSALSCSPAQPATLQFTTPQIPGETMTCTATYTVTPADVAAGTGKTNSASVTGTPPPVQGSPVSRTSTVTSTNAATPPTATDDSAGTPFNNPVTLPASTNDTAGTGTITNGSTVFTAAGATNGGKRLETAEGVWVVNGAGTVTFTPATGYTGTTPAVEYRVSDSNGLTDTGTLTVTVRTGPTASPNTATTAQDQNVTITPTGNDTPGPNGNGSAGSWVGSSVVFTPGAQPAGATISDGGKTLTVPGQGVYTINATSGAVTFDPAATFVGTASAVGYTATDSHGNTASSTIQVTVTAVDPVANDDSAATQFANPVVLPAGTDDQPGAGGSIDHGLTVLTAPGATNGGKTLETAQGTWQVLADGTVRFTPADGFSGTTDQVEYRITDTNGQTDVANLQVTVRPGPSGAADTEDTEQNVDVDVTPFTNDTPSRRADGTAGEFDPTTVRFAATGQPAGATVATDGLSMTVPGEGGYRIAPVSGVVTFDPDADFAGETSPVAYTVVDQAGNRTGSTITIDVTAVTPVAGDDAAKTPFEKPVTITPLVNDEPGAPSAPIAAGSIRFTDPTATDDGRRLETAQGVWEVNPDDTVTFTPADGFTGAVTPVEYEISDANGTTDTATITVVVGQRPLAAPDAGTTAQNVDVDVPTLGNDVPGDQGDPCAEGETAPADCDTGTFDPATVVFPADGQPAGATVTGGGRTLTVPGEGVYTIAAATGVVTFDPAPAFTGTAQAVTYQVTDSYGNVASSTVTVTVTAVTPQASDDSAVTPYRTAVTLPAVLDDDEGAPSAPLVPGATVFPTAGQPDGAEVTDAGKTLTVPGEGVYVVNTDGSVTFTPADGFDGPTTPVTYRIEDENGTRDTAQLLVTVRPGPQADDDTAETLQGQPVGIEVLTGDVPGDNADGTPASWVLTSVVFPTTGQPAGATVTDAGKTLTVPGEGVYTANPDGTVTFLPDPRFTGTTSPVTYQVTDSLGNPATAQVTVTVDDVTPSADDDTAATPFRTPVTFPFADNDDAGDPSVPIDATSGTFETGDNPAAWTISDAGKTITVPGQGSYTLLDDGTVTFTPAADFTGTTTPVTYTVRDANGTEAKADLTVTVRPGPLAQDDDPTGQQNVDLVISPLGNDAPGQNADGSTGSWVPGSVVFPTDGQPAGATVSPDGKTLTVPGEGEYTIRPDGTILFDPEPQLTGPASPVTYTATDSLGNDATAQIVVTVDAIVPVATDDTAETPFGTPVPLAGVTNDAAGADSAPLVPSLTVFPQAGQPAGAVVSSDGKTLTFEGEGEYVVQANGSVVFTPEAGFAGTTTPVTYRIEDENGTRDTATLEVTVRPGPEADDDDTATTPQNVTVTVPVLVNDVPGQNADGTAGSWDETSVVFPTDGQPAGATVSDDGTTITVPDEGVYTVQPDGTITFDPEPGFTGTTSPVTYEVTDSHGNPATAELTVDVTAIVPVANDDAASTTFATPVTLPGATDDAAGAASAPLRPELTVFPASGQPAGATVSGDGKTLTFEGEGEYVIQTDGSVVFTPAAGFEGTTTPVTYRIEDANGTRDTAQLTVTVQDGPSASPDDETTPQNVTVVIPVLVNDSPGLDADGEAGQWDLGSVVFPADGQPAEATVSADGMTLTVPGEGEYTIGADGRITFDPEPQFTGEASEVTYAVTDEFGNEVTSTLVVTVTPIAPVANDDAASTPFGTAVTLPGATDDAAGADSAPLVPGATIFPAAGQPDGATVSDDGTTLTVPGEGTYVVNGDGSVTFTPADGFTGTTTPVTYQVEDTNGTTDTAELTVTVRPGPVASPDTDTTPQNVDVTVAVLGNDVPGQNADGSAGTWVATSVVFTTAGQPAGATVSADGKTLTVPDEGEYTVNPDGTITFDPEPGFTGTASPVTYEVTDSLGNPATSTLTITVTDVVPEAKNDKVRTPHHTPVLIDVLGNDVAGSADAPLDPATLFLLDPETGDEVTRVVVPGEGTWTVVDGEVRFAPVRGFTGPVTPLDYVVSDVNGTQVSATIRVVVGPVGSAAPDEDVTTPGTPVTVDVLANDAAAPGEQLVPGSVCLLPGTAQGKAVAGGRAAQCVTEHTEDGVGTWVVEPDGTITFTPADGYTGTAEIGYTVEDTDGNVYESTVTVTVEDDAAVGGEGGDNGDGDDDGGIDLPGTGGPSVLWLGSGLALLILGAGLLLRRRRQA